MTKKDFPSSSIKKNGQGFTLIELIIVLGIIIILIVTAIPKIYFFTTMKLVGAANKIASDLRYAQQLAISRQLIHGILFDTNSNKYEVFVVNSLDKSTQIIEVPFAVYSSKGVPTDKKFIVDFTKDDTFKNVSFTIDPETVNTLSFDPWGRPLNDFANETELDSVLTIILKQGIDQIKIQISPQTGNVHILKPEKI